MGWGECSGWRTPNSKAGTAGQTHLRAIDTWAPHCSRLARLPLQCQSRLSPTAMGTRTGPPAPPMAVGQPQAGGCAGRALLVCV